VAASEQIAKAAGIGCVVIQSAANNKWRSRLVAKKGARAALKMRYDVTAQRMEYKYDRTTGDFVKYL